MILSQWIDCNGPPEDGLLPPGHAGLLLVGGGSHTLQLEASHGALGHGGALLQVLQEKASMRGSSKTSP